MSHIIRTVLCRALLPVVAAAALPQATPAGVTVYRDRWGIPSIVADTLPEAVFGLGYAMASDNVERMARCYKQARGRQAEADGPDRLAADGLVRSLGIEEAAEAAAKTLSGEQADLLRAFADGANRALSRQKGSLPGWVEPFSPADMLALMQFLNAAFPLLEIGQALAPGSGSNQFAVAGRRSATGHAILSADPHLPWDWNLVWYEFGLYTPGLKFRGITAMGLPAFVMGHTDRAAWSITNNNPRLYDFYTLRLRPEDPGQYSFHGEWRAFEEAAGELRFREGNALKTVPLSLRRTAWGPVLPGGNLALRLALVDHRKSLEQMLAMARAGSVSEFRQAFRPLGTSMWNYVFADIEGHIGYQYNARVPRRAGDFDWTQPVPGHDPRTRWGDFWALDDLPHAENPASGLLVNANSPPGLTPLGEETPADRWPGYVSSFGPTTRYERLSALMRSRTRISLRDAMRIATDTEVPHARKAVRALRRAAGRSVPSDLKPALTVLSAWNGRADAGSKGCALFTYWYRAAPQCPALTFKAGRGEPWSAEERHLALEALRTGAQAMKRDHGRLDIPWGAMHFARRGEKSVPVGGFGYVAGDGNAAVNPNNGPFLDGRIACAAGSSFRMIVHLAPGAVCSWSVLPYGNAHDPRSPHYSDQMELFARGGYKETHFGPDAARKSAVSVEKLER
ncbi:MAG: penicillin acylase family protein [Armatimonadetes bacterium]|nr:penicillin acylase family protein [Armatimonadota bacterium]